MNASSRNRVSAALPLPPAVTALLDSVQAAGHLEPANAAALLAGATLETADLARWQDLRHPPADSYGRKLIARGPHFELMLMSWLPGDYSAIHDHGRAEWGAVRYFGAAEHIVFDHDGDLLSTRERTRMGLDDVCAVDADLIHLMGNPGDRPFVSLHLYGRAEADPAITGGARIFDLFEDRIQRTDGGVFFCLPEHDIDRREPGPRADAETRLLHHRLMLSRIERMLGERELDIRLHQRARELRAAIVEIESSSAATGAETGLYGVAS